jgi:hypothetical protein
MLLIVHTNFKEFSMVLNNDSIFDTPRYSMKQAARRCGNVDVSTVWRWTLKGVHGIKLRTVKLGGRRYVLEPDLEAFVREVSAQAEGGAR